MNPHTNHTLLFFAPVATMLLAPAMLSSCAGHKLPDKAVEHITDAVHKVGEAVQEKTCSHYAEKLRELSEAVSDECAEDFAAALRERAGV